MVLTKTIKGDIFIYRKISVGKRKVKTMENKGFTLIELLAVIVILAIIALIATPIVLGIIEDSDKNANKISAQYIVDSVEKSYSIAYTQNQGIVPSIKMIRDEFSMSGATWVEDGGKNKIITGKTVAESDVVCVVEQNGNEIIVVCEGDYTGDTAISSATMEVSGN